MANFRLDGQPRCLARALWAALLFPLSPASAEESEAARASLPEVPRWVLSLPAPNGRSSEGGAKGYWQGSGAPAGWRDFADSELRLRVETGRWDFGGLSLVSEITSVPVRERDCQGDCRGPEWSSAVILKYDMGRVGPLEQVGPTLKVGGAPAQARQKVRTLSGVGVSGAF